MLTGTLLTTVGGGTSGMSQGSVVAGRLLGYTEGNGSRRRYFRAPDVLGRIGPERLLPTASAVTNHGLNKAPIHQAAKPNGHTWASMPSQ